MCHTSIRQRWDTHSMAGAAHISVIKTREGRRAEPISSVCMFDCMQLNSTGMHRFGSRYPLSGLRILIHVVMEKPLRSRVCYLPRNGHTESWRKLPKYTYQHKDDRHMNSTSLTCRVGMIPCPLLDVCNMIFVFPNGIKSCPSVP